MIENLLNVDRVAFTIKGFSVYWYGVIMCLAMVAAIVVAIVLCKIKKVEIETPINVALIVLPSGILSARLFSVIFEKELSIKDYFNFRTGGMSIIGAIIGAAIALTIYSFIKKDKQFFKYFDTVCAVLLLAQAIGRWGNYFNGEVYGQLVENPVVKGLPFVVEVDGQYYRALFLYESVLDLIGFFFTAEIFTGVKKYSGATTAFYLVYYGVVRSFLENMRNEKYVLMLGSIKVSMLCSILMICCGIGLFILIHFLNKKNKTSSRRL